MNIGRKRFNWIIGACIVSMIHGLGGFASRADAQTLASRVATRSSTSAASTSRDADPANAELQHRVAAALHAQCYFVDRHIDVSADGGVVVLSGIVFSDWDLRDALYTARKAAGGRPVVDSLSIEEGGR
jgi:osmotically-inducible protein OsmY